MEDFVSKRIFTFKSHMIKYGLDHWILGPLDFFGTILGSFSEQFFWTIILGDDIPLVLRKGWDTVYQYSGRGGRQTVVTEGGVGSCCINKCYQ